MNIGTLIEQRAGSDIIAIERDSSVREAVELLASKRIGALPVMEGDRVVGIFSERDVIYRLSADGQTCLDQPVGEVMTAPPITVGLNISTLEALGLMTKRRIRHLPVVEGEALLGFISIGDLVKSRFDQIQHEAEAMRNYIQTA